MTACMLVGIVVHGCLHGNVGTKIGFVLRTKGIMVPVNEGEGFLLSIHIRISMITKK